MKNTKANFIMLMKEICGQMDLEITENSSIKVAVWFALRKLSGALSALNALVAHVEINKNNDVIISPIHKGYNYSININHPGFLDKFEKTIKQCLRYHLVHVEKITNKHRKSFLEAKEVENHIKRIIETELWIS